MFSSVGVLAPKLLIVSAEPLKGYYRKKKRRKEEERDIESQVMITPVSSLSLFSLTCHR